MLLEDYKYAALNILWSCVADDNKKTIRTIIFAFIELFPKEFPKPIEIEEKEGPQKKSSRRIYYKRIICSVKRILCWYGNAIEKKRLNMFWEKDKLFEIINYEQEPDSPDLDFLLIKDHPFLPDNIGCVRSHFLFEKNFPEEIKDLCLKDKNLEWINDNFKFDMSLYPEYLGSLCLVAYNPIIRRIQSRLVVNEATGNQSVYFEVEPRKDVDISRVKLMFIEKRNLGYKNFQEKLLKEELFFTIENMGKLETIGYAVVCPDRGLLSWEGFHGFLRGMSMNINIVDGKFNIHVPNKDYSETEEIYEKPRYIRCTSITSPIRKENKIESLSKKIEKSRSLVQQKLFYNNPKEASAFVRELISKAKNKIIIIDPYIRTRELWKFALSMDLAVKTTLITSSLVLKDSKYKEQAQELFDNINEVSCFYKIEAFVMCGKKPAFHDRFIFIDDEIWILGNSLTDIGERASIFIKSPDPEEIKNIYDKIISDKQKIVKLEEWIENKKS
ncbi:MAG: hypothetical protein J6P19_02205 [Acetobacter sp.]|nr:hypothetical protein [Acetobacter sp.]